MTVMEVKRPVSSTIAEKKSVNKAENFVAETKSELKKINWTSRAELIAYTKIVMIATFLFGLGVYCIDLVIQGFLSGLGILIRTISG